MILMKNAIQAGSLSPLAGIGIIGFSVGLALLFSSMYQGMCAASGIHASAKQPAILGKTMAALGIKGNAAKIFRAIGIAIPPKLLKLSSETQSVQNAADVVAQTV
jgi:F0F1-type ATP synthase membrane subunit c/vacuolar-type H+-ATPase subunit K